MSDPVVPKAVIYARVSLDKDMDSPQFQNPDNQLMPLRKQVEALGYSLVGEYIDRCSGGSADRPEFQRMLADARQNKFSVIFIWSLDRFSREGILKTLGYLQMLKQYRIAIKSYSEGLIDTTSTGAGELIIAILAWAAEHERKRISERTKAALVRHRNLGHVLGRPKGSKDSKPRKRGG